MFYWLFSQNFIIIQESSIKKKQAGLGKLKKDKLIHFFNVRKRERDTGKNQNRINYAVDVVMIAN
jgi:hypothetical protein